MQLVIGDLLRQSALKFPRRLAITGEEVNFTYEELNGRVNRLANGLLSGGLKKGDKLGILLMNCYQFLELIMACAKAGIVMVPINWRFQPSEIRYVVENSDATALIMGEEFIPVMREAAPEIPGVAKDRYWVVGNSRFSPDGGLYDELLSRGADHEPDVSVYPDDVFFLGYTSGTTGFPKGAVILHKTDVELAITVNIEYEVAGVLANLIVMPTFHSNSIWNTVSSFLNGVTVYIYHLRGFNGEEILKIIDTYKINMSSMVPTMYHLILGQPEEVRAKYDVSSMKVLLSSSAPISHETKKSILAFFKSARLFEGYGSTETGVVTTLRPEDQLSKPGSIGKAAFGKQVKILDDEGREPPRGQIGEIYTRGLNVFAGYYKNPEATKKAFIGDWCTVGDMGSMDEEGYVYLVDRKNDMIISGGENVYPTEVENVILQHPSVQFAAVVGVPDELWGESVKAVVMLKPGTQASGEEIIGFTKGKLAGYKRPKSVDFVTQMPMTPTGKILRRLVKEPYWKDRKTRI
jgi:acyl-CoA synthetase (AMP-forming)/AMP-acid ligase II